MAEFYYHCTINLHPILSEGGRIRPAWSMGFSNVSMYKTENGGNFARHDDSKYYKMPDNHSYKRPNFPLSCALVFTEAVEEDPQRKGEHEWLIRATEATFDVLNHPAFHGIYVPDGYAISFDRLIALLAFHNKPGIKVRYGNTGLAEANGGFVEVGNLPTFVDLGGQLSAAAGNDRTLKHVAEFNRNHMWEATAARPSMLTQLLMMRPRTSALSAQGARPAARPPRWWHTLICCSSLPEETALAVRGEYRTGV